MPELPEVEVTRAGLAERLAGATVRAVQVGKPLRWPLGLAPQALVGATLGTMARRGKYLWLPARHHGPGGVDGGLLIHLGMSGSLSLAPATSGSGEPGPHDHFVMRTSAGTLTLTDPRRFGAVVWSDALDRDPARKLLAGLGAEPFDPEFTSQFLHAALKRRRCAIKQALLAGDIVVGAGNIYASEALFASGIDPRTRCDRLSLPRCERLLAALRATLARAIDLGGSTLRDFRDAHGIAGAFQSQARVYDREGLPCLHCGTPIRRIVQGQRATYFCPTCQRR